MRQHDEIPQELTDEELDALAAISPEDIERARLAWREDTKGTGFESLLDAAPSPDPED